MARRISDIIYDQNTPDPFQVLTQTDQLAKEREYRSQQVRLKQNEQRMKSYEMVRESFDPELWKPLAEKVQPEVNKYYEEFASEVAATGADPYELHFSPKWTKLRGQVELNARKSNAVGEVFKTQYETIDEGEHLKKDAAKAYLSSVIHDTDYNELSAGQVAKALDTPAFFDRNSAITSIAKTIEDQISEETSGGLWEQNGKVLGRKKGSSLRFEEENGRIAPVTVQHFINANPNIAESIRFEMALEDYQQSTGKNADVRLASDHNAVMQIYNDKYKDDDSPEMKQRIRDQVEEGLSVLQKRSTKNEIQNFGNIPQNDSNGDSEEDSASNNVVRDIIAPAIGYRTELDPNKLQALFSPFSDIKADYDYSNADTGSPSGITISRRKEDVMGNIIYEPIKQIDISDPSKTEGAIASIYQMYNRLQPTRLQTSSKTYLDQKSEYDSERTEAAKSKYSSNRESKPGTGGIY